MFPKYMCGSARSINMNCKMCNCRNGKRGQGWERKYMVLDGNKVLTYETEPREGYYFLNYNQSKVICPQNKYISNFLK